MAKLILPRDYSPKLAVRDMQRAIKMAKDRFEHELAFNLNLERISAPLFVRPESGLNDGLSGVERPVDFEIKDMGCSVEIVHSLAKWKRYALKHYGFECGRGLYTDMNAIRRDEELDNTHSVYVDQWDWEMVITGQQRDIDTLQSAVKKICRALRNTEKYICGEFDALERDVADDIFFITSQELEDMYPGLDAKRREDAICKQHKLVFLMQIGDRLKSGAPHDSRAPDYDDWSLNGDILVWNEVLSCAFELSSMGIRVDEKALSSQLEKAGCPERAAMPFHRALLSGGLPLTIGGGIGQSRLCMYMLGCAHIGEVQVSVWPDDMIKQCEENKIFLL